MSGKSRIEKILENLLGENDVIEPPIGRDEKILYSILNDLEYTDPPHSIFEDLLLAIKTGNVPRTAYAYDNLTRDEKILFCKLNRREYFEPPHSRLERLLIKWLYLDLYLNIDGVPPFTFVSNGSPIVDYIIYGNAETSGTSTPVSLVIPSGAGEKTSNLFDISTAALGKWINSAGEEKTSSVATQEYKLNHTDYIPVEPNTEYVFSYDGDYSVASTAAMCWFNANKEIISKSDYSIGGQKVYSFSATAPSNAAFCIVNFSGYNGVGKSDMIFAVGSTAPSYEPFGYKATVSCGDTLTSIYLGEVLSTRRIKKLVLTGEENFVYDSAYTRFHFTMPNSLILGVRRTPVICTHYETITDGRPIEEVTRNTIYSDSAAANRWWIEAEDFTSANDFKAYLAEQYAAGTPVTIWYILTEPETAIVNEPLMKIGDYADSISYEQTVVSIPTVSGRNTFDVLGDVKPSNVELTYAPRAPLLGKRKTVLKK